MTDKDFTEVTVKEAAHEDAGRGIARVSIEVMKKLGMVSGDVIEIQGKKKAAAIVWPGFQQDTGYAILRIDGNIRSNLIPVLMKRSGYANQKRNMQRKW